MNEDFTFDPDDDETFLEASAAFLRLGIGYMFGDRFSASIHAGYDYHPIHAIHAFPTYAKLRYNLWRILKTHFLYSMVEVKCGVRLPDLPMEIITISDLVGN